MAKRKTRSDGRLLRVIRDPNTKKKLFFYGKTERELTQKILEYTQRAQTGDKFIKVAEDWYNEATPDLAYQSLKSYKPAYKDAIDEFGDELIKQITAKDVSAYLRRLAKRGLSAKTIAQRRLVLNLIFKHAQSTGGVEVNPCTSAVMPKDLPKQQRHAATSNDEEIIKNTSDIWLFPFFALMTGMRKGEILALQWRDIDFGNDLISVTKSVYHEGDRPKIKKPKTDESIRYVPLLAPLKEKLLQTNQRPEQQYIFTYDGITPLSNRRFTTMMKKYQEETGVTCTAHELRHSFATIAIENGIDAKIVQSILGHKQLSTTMDIYTDIRKSAIIRATEKLNKIF